jgi:hypothetical protein
MHCNPKNNQTAANFLREAASAAYLREAPPWGASGGTRGSETAKRYLKKKEIQTELPGRRPSSREAPPWGAPGGTRGSARGAYWVVTHGMATTPLGSSIGVPGDLTRLGDDPSGV